MQNKENAIYLQQGNVQFRGKVKIGDIVLTNQQFSELLLDNVSWKRYVSYPFGQVCSIKIQNSTVFYYSLVNNNLNHNPSSVDSISYWKPISIDSSQSHDLIFKIPTIQSDDSLSLQIQFSHNEDFETNIQYVYSFSQNSSDSGDSSLNAFYISDPQSNKIHLIDNTMISSKYSNQILIFKKQFVSDIYTYFRYRWYSSKYDSYTKYYFGAINSQIQTFDSNIAESGYIHTDNINIIGNGTQANPLILNKQIKVRKIDGDDNFNISTSSSNITINTANGNGQFVLNSSDIIFNSNRTNQANGLVVLNQYGKIDQDLYIDGNFNNRLLPLKTSVSQSLFGNPLVIYKTAQIQSNVQNDSSTILLLQDSSRNNAAVSNSDNILYKDVITEYDQQNFCGGYKIGLNPRFSNSSESSDSSFSSAEDLQYGVFLNNNLQIAIQIQNIGLSQQYFKSVFQHFTSSGQLCYLSVKKSGFVFGIQSNPSLFVPFSEIGNQQYYKFVVQYKYDTETKKHYSQIYCNGSLCLTYEFDEYPFGVNETYEDGMYTYIYFCQQISERSTQIYLNGLNTYWRLLKVDLSLKDSEIEKQIGQLYDSSQNINYNNIKVDYNWSFNDDTNGAMIFGKKDGVPYIFPYPNTEFSFPIASRTQRGGVIVGNGLYVDANGVISVNSSSDGILDLGNYIQGVEETLNKHGNIEIRSNIVNDSTVTIQSGDNNICGKLFLGSGNENELYSILQWTGLDTVSSINLGYNSTKIKHNDVQIDLNNTSVNIKSDNLLINGNGLNQANGLVKLDENGKINNALLNIQTSNENIIFSNKVVVYDSSDNEYQCNGIKAGSGVTIQIQNGVAVINSDEQGNVRSDIVITYNSLTHKQNGRYTFVVNNINLGGFVVQDDEGYIIYPPMRQVSINGTNSVEIDFTQFVGDHGLRITNINQQEIQYKIRFVRGYKGNDGQLTKDQALNLILTYLF